MKKIKLFLLGTMSVMAISSLYAQNGLHFDAIDDYIQTSYGGIPGNNPRTIEAWINTSTTNADAHVIVDYGYFGTGSWDNGKRFTLGLNNAHQLRLEIRGWGINGTSTLNDGNWHHVAVSYNGNAIKLYVDGVQEAVGSPAISINTTLNTDLLIGTRTDLPNKLFDGTIDEIRIWNVAKTQQEITANINNEICGSPSDLVAYFKLNEGVAGGINTAINTTTEEVASANGTLNNFALSGSTSNWVVGSNIAVGAVVNNLTINECAGYSITVGTNTYNTTGNYSDTLVGASSNGCDSIVNTDLTVAAVIDNSVNISGLTITANQNGATYKWIDCNSNMYISGETAQNFTATNSGSYAVEVTIGNCVDTSSCEQLTITSIGEQEAINNAIIYPNPTEGLTNIRSNDNFNLYVNDITGKKLFSETNIQNNYVLNLSAFKSGVYYVIIETEKERQVRRLLKK